MRSDTTLISFLLPTQWLPYNKSLARLPTHASASICTYIINRVLYSTVPSAVRQLRRLPDTRYHNRRGPDRSRSAISVARHITARLQSATTPSSAMHSDPLLPFALTERVPDQPTRCLAVSGPVGASGARSRAVPEPTPFANSMVTEWRGYVRRLVVKNV